MDMIDTFFYLLYRVSPSLFEIIEYFFRITVTDKCNRQLIILDGINYRYIRLIKPAVCIYFVIIINAYIVSGTFVFDDVVLTKDPSDILVYRLVRILLNNQNINFHGLITQLMFIFEDQLMSFFFQLNLHARVKCLMPLQQLFFCTSFRHLKPPYEIVTGDFSFRKLLL